MKRKALTIAAVLLLLVGLGVFLYPTFYDLYSRWQAEQVIEQYTYVAEPDKADYSAEWAAADAYNETVAENGIFSSAVYALDPSQLLNPLGTGMMGYLDIPKIDVHLPIYQGTEERELQSGCGWWIGTSLPTGGEGTHCVLTGHTGLTKAKMFTDIDQLEPGDTFTLSVLDRVLTYEVDQILTVLPDDIEPLQVEPGKDYVTLYTCTPYGINTHRLLVRGHRVPTPAAAETPPAGTGPSTMELVLCGVLPAVMVLAVLLLVRAVRRRCRIRDPRNHYLDARAEKRRKKREKPPPARATEKSRSRCEDSPERRRRNRYR